MEAKIKPQGLRLENLLTFNGKVFRVTSINNNYIIGDRGKGGVEFRLKDNELSPIPLSEDWLIRMGFHKASNGWFRLTEMPSQNKEIVTLHINVETFSTAVFGDEALEPSYIKECKTVHQMQNLWYSIFGSELTIKDINNIEVK